jgi:hypothetical protein
VGYSINQGGTTSVPFEEVKRVVDASFATWVTASRCDTGQPTPGITASNLGTAACSEIGFSSITGNQNLVLFRDAKWPHSEPSLTLGLSTVTFNSGTGEIFDADIEINSSKGDLSTSDPVPANKVDLQVVLTHEIGHFFGLAHTTSAQATMAVKYDTKTTLSRTLSPDDVAGLCAIYPTAKLRSVEFAGSPPLLEGTACDATPRNGLSTECVGDGSDNPSTLPGDKCSCKVPAPSPSGGNALFLLAIAGLGLFAARHKSQAKHRRRAP